MLFFGTNKSKLKQGTLHNITCSNCNNITKMDYVIHGKYAHVWWVPVFPSGRIALFECQGCKRLFTLPELPESIKTKYQFEKQGLRTPIWFYSGLFIIGMLILVAIGSNQITKQNNADYIENPLVNDFYGIKGESSGYYSTMKVVKVTSDSIFVIYNDLEVNKRSQVKNLNRDKNYTSSPVGYTREELRINFKGDYIFRIFRE